MTKYTYILILALSENSLSTKLLEIKMQIMREKLKLLHSNFGMYLGILCHANNYVDEVNLEQRDSLARPIKDYIILKNILPSNNNNRLHTSKNLNGTV